MKRKLFYTLILILIFFLIQNIISQNDFPTLKGLYLGQKPPKNVAEIFAPGIVTTDLHDDASPIFSPDGKEMYFRIVYKLNEKYFSTIFWMTQYTGKWSYPEVAPFSGRYLDGGITFFPDGQGILFFSDRGSQSSESYNIDFWQIEKKVDFWPLPNKIHVLNTPSAELYPFFASNDNLYWTVEKEMNDPKPKIYRARFNNSLFSEIEEVCLFPDLNKTYYVFDFAPDCSYLILLIDDNDNMGDLYVSFKQDNGTWGTPINLGPDVNSKYMEKSASISPDGNFLFFVSNRPSPKSNPQRLWNSDIFEGQQKIYGADVYWISTKVINKFK